MLAAQFAADAQVERQRALDLLPDERLLDGDSLEFGGEGRMAAMVAPIGVEDPQLGLIGIAPLGAEVGHHLAQVVGIHCQAVRRAEVVELLVGHVAEALEHLDGA